MTKYYWNGEECRVEFEMWVIPPAEKPTYWYAHLEGQEREVVAVYYPPDNPHPFHLDNHDGQAVEKLTKGKGSWRWPHRNIFF